MSDHTCIRCSATVVRTSKTGPHPKYCGDDCRRPPILCRTCGKRLDYKSGPRKYCSDPCKPRCSVTGCGDSIRRNGLCEEHSTRRKNRGSPTATINYRWAIQKKCIVCGTSDWPGKGRKTCSPRCAQLNFRYRGRVAKTAECQVCGMLIDLKVTGENTRKRRTDVKQCDLCKSAHYTRHRVSVAVLAKRDRDKCGICALKVNMQLRHPDPMSPSVDHILPFSLGGTHDPENLQLAHKRCNMLKSNRILKPLAVPLF